MHILIHALRGFAAVRDEDGIAGEKNARPRLPLEALLVCSPTLLKLVQKYVDFQTYGPKKIPHNSVWWMWGIYSVVLADSLGGYLP